MTGNPLLAPWTAPFAAPPFDAIAPEQFRPAYAQALAGHRAEIEAIAASPDAPSFENTIAALERGGRTLARVGAVFHNLCSSHTNPALQEIEREMAPVLARHANAIYLDPRLFARIDAVYAQRENISGEERRVLERYHLDFVRAGAQLQGAARERFAAINEQLASLGTDFAQAVLADEQETLIALSEEEVAGLPDFARDAAGETARERGLGVPYAVTASRGSAEAVLTFAEDRAVRERVLRAWLSRGARGNAHDNRARIGQIVRLRTELAHLLGYNSFAAYRLADTMAKTPAAARHLLERVWQPALARAQAERSDLQGLMAAEGSNFPLAAWDWRYYAERLRKQRFDIDEAEIMAYLPLEAMIEAAFDAASRLFGLSFRARHDVPVLHPDMRVWEVRRGDAPIGLFYGDYFARASKRGGAWMSSFRDQENLDGPVLPLIVNTCNFTKPAPGKPALLAYDEARTLFHEFGHALHGLLSNVRYPRLAGTNVAQDFVELPSQLFEHWLEPQLERFARHGETGAAMPQALRDRLKAARHFNQGFATVEFLGSAFADLDFHMRETADAPDADAIARESAAALGLPEEIPLRHAPAHFQHIFAGDGYAAGYYSYLWAEVLDADGYAAFEEAGDPFDAATAKRLYENIYSAGGTRDYAQAYRDFRGRDPKVEALLEGRGLT